MLATGQKQSLKVAIYSVGILSSKRHSSVIFRLLYNLLTFVVSILGNISFPSPISVCGFSIQECFLIKIFYDKQGRAGSMKMGAIVAPPWVNEGDYADADDKRHSDILGME